MSLILDHVFVLTDPPALVADALLQIGLVEGRANVHAGQGTSNRRFFFDGFTIEFLYISDKNEALNGAGKMLELQQRQASASASPFGVIVRSTDHVHAPTFSSWQYQPDYFPADMSFYVGANSHNALEPLCICMPPLLPKKKQSAPIDNSQWTLTNVQMHVPVKSPSCVLRQFAKVQKIQMVYDQTHNMTLTFNHGALNKRHSLLPELPLTLEW